MAIADQVAAVWIPTTTEGALPMRDVVVLAVIAAFFALCLAYVRWCDHIIGPDPVDRPDDELDGGRHDAALDAERGVGVIIAAAADNWIGLGLSVLLTIYLVVVLVRPERF